MRFPDLILVPQALHTAESQMLSWLLHGNHTGLF